jgi:hypothetical protein
MRVRLLLGDGAHVPAADVPLASLGLGASSTVVCSLAPVVQVACCEPSVGPDAGGTMVRIHGEGFTEATFGAASHARVEFGGHAVPCWRMSDTLLGCRTPAHAPATVSVRLLGCEAEHGGSGGGGGGGGGSDASGATACFEFVRLEHMYDAIFASTNSHCPLWGGESPAGAQGRDGSAQGDEQLPQPPSPPLPPRFGF